MADDGFFDEMLGTNAATRQPYTSYASWFDGEDLKDLHKKATEAERFFRKTGITFNVYGQAEADERLIPFDVIPRILSGQEWTRLTKGIEQRVRAINAFLHDIYHRQEILKAGRIPESLIARNDAFLPQMIGVTPPGGVYTHIVGVDLVRTGENEFFVLEDNARTPSGVSYMLENRETMLQMFPELFGQIKVRSVSDYPIKLRRSLAGCLPERCSDQPTIAVLTPGIHNSAYFEHAFLADNMGVELVEGQDLRVIDGKIAMRTTRGYKPIDVIYRRVDDDFLDPLAFNKDSMLGVPGLFEAYRAGNIALANAPGTGIADDKVVYAYVPEIIKYYLDEEPIIPNVPTYLCFDEEQRRYVLDNLDKLVVKPANESGGYGMLIGPRSTKEEQAKFAELIQARPRNYIAQPTLSLSRVPILLDDRLEGRHVDLRPFIIYGKDIFVLPGGLTRVALKKGSLVVNSSQGGGSKDTWVIDEDYSC